MLSPEEIASRKFLISLRGYDRDEVTRFLREVAQEHGRLRDRVRELEEQRDAIRNEVANVRGDGGERPPKSAREAFTALGEETTRILVAAEESAEEIRRRAAERARNDLEQARRDAREEVDGARRTGNKIVAEAERRRDEVMEELRELEATRDRYMQALRGAMDSVQTAVRELAGEEAEEDLEPELPEDDDAADETDADRIRRAVAPAGPAMDGDEIVAGHDHVDPDETTRSALEEDDVTPVGAAVAATPASDEEDVDEAVETAAATADLGVEEPEPAAVSEAEPEPEAAPELEQEPEQELAVEGPDPIALRTEALADVRPSMLRRLKRVLQDVQNGVLDAIRRHATEGGGVDVLLPADQDLAAMGEVGGVFLNAAYQAGLADGAGMVDADPTSVEGDGARVPASTATFQAVLSHEITSSLAATLRAGIEAGEPETSLSERVGEVFRDLKGPVLESVVSEQLVRLYGFGVLDGWERLGATATKAWVLGEEPRCPANQCRTNVSEGAVGLRDAFPSGEQVPPAHDACTCAIAPGQG